MYDTVIFDLDGTLLDTLQDLANSANFALKEFGYPERSLDEVRSFVGNGTRRLMELCCPDGEDNPRFEALYGVFQRHYDEHCQDNTKPYDGVIELLNELTKKEYKLAIVSNKPDGPCKELCRRFFGNYISVAIGEKPTVKKKPAPDTVNKALSELFSEKWEAVYVGDSEVDIQTAKNAGVDCISVTWGFRTEEWLRDNGGTLFAHEPKDVLKLL